MTKTKYTIVQLFQQPNQPGQPLHTINVNFLFIAVLALLAFAIYMKADTADLFTFAGSVLAYLFGREHGRREDG